MPTESEILAYYAARANEYEKVYAKPENQTDIRLLQQLVPAYLTGRRVLDVACRTGYWTRLIADRAAEVTAVDVSPEVLAVARTQQPANRPATFVVADAYELEQVTGTFDAAFVGFWWSRVPPQDLHRFLAGLHRRLVPGSLVIVLDDRPPEEVPGSFPLRNEVHRAIAVAGGTSISVREFDHYWFAAYTVPGTPN
jgi:ubiquinone/menaquinone biosynthesis C-methylase UbiE